MIGVIHSHRSTIHKLKVMALIDRGIILIRYQRLFAAYFLPLKNRTPKHPKKKPDLFPQLFSRLSKWLDRILCPMLNTAVISVIDFMDLIRCPI